VIVTAPGPEGDAQMVESLLSLRGFYEAFLKKGVEERTWLDAINDAFAKGFSARKNKPAEMIGASLPYIAVRRIGLMDFQLNLSMLRCARVRRMRQTKSSSYISGGY